MRLGHIAASALIMALGWTSVATARGVVDSDTLPRRASLGVGFEATPEGPKVLAVTPNSTAAMGGIQVGDIITRINDRAIADNRALLEAAAALRAGAPTRMTVQRAGQAVTGVATATARPLESFENADVSYGAVAFNGGQLRDILVTPHQPAAGNPVVFLVQGYGCGSVEGGPTHPYHLLAKTLADQGVASYRIEKSGMGDSQSPVTCINTDFDIEMSGFRAAYQALIQARGIAPERIIMLGHSMGGVQAPLLAAQGPKPRGIVVYGTVARNWQDYIQEVMSIQGFHSAASDPAEGERLGFATRELNRLMFNTDKPLKDIAAQSPDMAELLQLAWSWDGNDQVLGRNIDYWRGVARQRVIAAWRDTHAPVLTIYAEADFAAIDARDHQLIADIVNHYRPGTARFTQLAQSGHGFELQDTRDAVRQANKAGQTLVKAPFNPQIAVIISDWIKSL